MTIPSWIDIDALVPESRRDRADVLADELEHIEPRIVALLSESGEVLGTVEAASRALTAHLRAAGADLYTLDAVYPVVEALAGMGRLAAVVGRIATAAEVASTGYVDADDAE